jgi:hypothetical protein
MTGPFLLVPTDVLKTESKAVMAFSTRRIEQQQCNEINEADRPKETKHTPDRQRVIDALAFLVIRQQLLNGRSGAASLKESARSEQDSTEQLTAVDRRDTTHPS